MGLSSSGRGAGFVWVMTGMLVVSGCGGPIDPSRLTIPRHSEGGGHVEPQPRNEVSIVRATDLGTIAMPPHVLARDGGLSGVVDGRSVWLFGDTIIDRDHLVSMESNSWAFTDDFDATNGIDFSYPEQGGIPASFLLETDAERAFDVEHAGPRCRVKPCGARWALWPEALIFDPERRRALVFYAKMYAEPGPFNFWVAQSSIAVWNDFATPPDRQLDAATGEPAMELAEPAFGNARVATADLVYAYRCENDGLSKPCMVARVPLALTLEPSAWSYYSSELGWTPDALGATPVIDGNDIMSVAYNAYLGRYLAVYAPPLSNSVVMRTAPRPEGPWSEPVTAFATRVPSQLWVYDAQAHPEYERDGGRLQYVTYSLTTSETTSEMRLVEVELASPGSSKRPMDVAGPGAPL